MSERQLRMRIVAVGLVALLLGGLVQGLATSTTAPPVGHVHAAMNDHRSMYYGGLPSLGDDVAPLQAQTICDDDGSNCLTVLGLGERGPNRVYLDEQPADLSIARSYDGDPNTGMPVCLPWHKDTHEIGPFYVLDHEVQQQHSYGAPVPGAATAGCVRPHFQTAENFIGKQVNGAGIDGTGRRSPVALVHGHVIEVPNPCWQKPCGASVPGRYLHFEGKLGVFEIAIGSGGEVWYNKQFERDPASYKRHLNGHTFGQDRVPLYPEHYTGADGAPRLGSYIPLGDSAAFQWHTCGIASPKLPGDEGVPCVKSIVNAGRGAAGKVVQNPNVTGIPTDRFGNRLLPLSYDHVRCLHLQADITQPLTRTGDGAWLNPHEWDVRPPARVLGYLPPECAPSMDVARAMAYPPEGMIGVPNAAPAPEPTGVPAETPTATPEPTPIPTPGEPTATPTQEPTATATPEPAARKPFPHNLSHYYNNRDLAGPPAIAIDHGTTLPVEYFYGDGSPVEGIGADNWSVVHYGTLADTISALHVRCDDVCRVVVNDVVEWEGAAFSTITIPMIHVDTAPVPVRVELVETEGDAYVSVSYTP